MQSLSPEDAVAAARALTQQGGRRILGLTGPPGVGKSTLSALLAERLGQDVTVVGMDGFHLANAELERLGRRGRKGAPDTFDVDGYVTLLSRLREQSRPIYAPVFDRGLEESIGSALFVDPAVPLIITEGNYLLHDAEDWQAVRPLLDAVWYLALDDQERRARLIQRRIGFGDTDADARRWVDLIDQSNADLIARTQAEADVIVRMG